MKPHFQRCKIINDVKNSIERGDDILLIDMEMIYESLYDVLNQYYKEWQGKKYVLLFDAISL